MHQRSSCFGHFGGLKCNVLFHKMHAVNPVLHYQCFFNVILEIFGIFKIYFLRNDISHSLAGVGDYYYRSSTDSLKMNINIHEDKKKLLVATQNLWPVTK